MNSMLTRVLGACVVLIVMSSPAPAETELRILSYPVGLVVGNLEVRVDLGDSPTGAELLLDGQPVCDLEPGTSSCTVNVGADPHVHLLELVRRNEKGEVVESASRWLNRPGQEAQLEIIKGSATGRRCSARLSWTHPDRLDPGSVEIMLGDRKLDLERDGRTVEYRCPGSDDPQVMVASAVFPDGRRAEAVAVLAGFAGETGQGLAAYPLISSEQQECETGAAGWPSNAEQIEAASFEAVIVLDPSAGYNTLFQSGWFPGRVGGSQTVTTKVFDTLVQSTTSSGGPRPRPSWARAEKTLYDSERLWFVIPDHRLTRVNAFGEGRSAWMSLLFKLGPTKLRGEPRIADAVAASGLVAGAGPRRRAVILLLGDAAHRDSSRLSVHQARSYLAEVGVPLVVLRNGRLRDDGWPAGMPTRNMESMAEGLEAVQDLLERQCVAWFAGRPSPGEVVASLPDGVFLAGLEPGAQHEWTAEIEEMPTADSWVGSGQESFDGRMEITATSMLISATDEHGEPITDLVSTELDVAEDGFPVQVVSLEPVVTAAQLEASAAESEHGDEPRPSISLRSQEEAGLPISIYIERQLAGSMTLAPALKALAAQAGKLVAAGSVEIIIADDGIETAREPTRDGSALAASLERLASEPGGRSRIELIRQRFIRDIRTLPARITRSQQMQLDESNRRPLAAIDTPEDGPDSSVIIMERGRVKNAALAHASEEDALLRRSMGRLRAWALGAPIGEPRLLMIVGAGFDEDPMQFYLPFVEKEEPQHAAQLRTDLKQQRQSQRLQSLAVDLAAARWRILGVAGHSTASIAIGAEQHLGDRFQAFLTASPEAVRSSDPGWLMLDPVSTQRRLAEPSGGTLVVGAEQLNQELDRMTGWYRLTYQIERPPDGALHNIDVLPLRTGLELRLPRQIASETTEGQASARLLRLLRGHVPDTTLATRLSVEPGESLGDRRQGTLRLETALEPVRELITRQGGGLLRVSVAVSIPDAEPFILHRTEPVEAGIAAFRYEVPLEWPRSASRIIVTVEEMASGSWGGSSAELDQ